MKKIVVIFIVWVVSIFLVNKVSTIFLVDRTSYELPYNLSIPARFTLLPFLNFDGRNYLEISLNGYHLDSQGRNLMAFFPLYPLAIRAVSIVGINPVISGLIISYMSAFLCLLVLYRLVQNDFDNNTALKSVVLLVSFPTAFYLISFYSESLFLLLALVSFLSISKSNYTKSALAASLASAARFFGLALSVVLFYRELQHFKSRKKYSAAVLIAPLGFIVYFVFAAVKNGSVFALTTSYQAWDRSLSILNPISIYIKSVLNILAGRLASYDSAFVYPIIIIEFLALLYLTFMVFYTLKKIKDIYWVHLAAIFIIVLFISYPSSLPRYLLPIFPLYIFWAGRLKGWKFNLVVIISFLLQMFLAGLFLRGYWVS